MIQASRIYIGAVAEDSSGYPDCRPEFYAAFQQVIDLGTKPQTTVEIRTPIIAMKKREIVLRGTIAGSASRTYLVVLSGIRGACGMCDSCALRLRAFREAGVTDPIPYALDSQRFAY